MQIVIAFIAGLFIGAAVGLSALALCKMSSQCDDEIPLGVEAANLEEVHRVQ